MTSPQTESPLKYFDSEKHAEVVAWNIVFQRTVRDAHDIDVRRTWRGSTRFRVSDVVGPSIVAVVLHSGNSE